MIRDRWTTYAMVLLHNAFERPCAILEIVLQEHRSGGALLPYHGAMSGSWTPGDKLTLLGLAIGVPLTILGFFPGEVRQWVGADSPQTRRDAPAALNATVGSSPPVMIGTRPPTSVTAEHIPPRSTTNPAKTVPEPRKSAPSRVTESPRHEITRSGGAKDVDEIVIAAEDVLDALRAQSHTARVRLRADQSAPDDTLQGLITTDLVLDVKLIDGTGSVNQSFTVTSRGGGFSSDASALQARTRLMSELRNRIGKESS
jgi:hypothetical protein